MFGKQFIQQLCRLNVLLCMFLCLTFGLGGQPYQLCIDSDNHVAFELTGSQCFLEDHLGAQSDGAEQAMAAGPHCTDIALAESGSAEIKLIAVPAPNVVLVLEASTVNGRVPTRSSETVKPVFAHLPDPLVPERRLANLRI